LISSPIPSTGHHLSNGEYMEISMDDNHNCSVLYYVRQLYTMIHACTHQQFLNLRFIYVLILFYF